MKFNVNRNGLVGEFVKESIECGERETDTVRQIKDLIESLSEDSDETILAKEVNQDTKSITERYIKHLERRRLLCDLCGGELRIHPDKRLGTCSCCGMTYAHLSVKERYFDSWIKITPVPENAAPISYIHVSGGNHCITLENNILSYRNTISSNMAPMYRNTPKHFFEEKKEVLSELDTQELLASLQKISLIPLYRAMIADPEGTESHDGAPMDILEIQYADGQCFVFKMIRSVPKEFHEIYTILYSYCSFETVPSTPFTPICEEEMKQIFGNIMPNDEF